MKNRYFQSGGLYFDDADYTLMDKQIQDMDYLNLNLDQSTSESSKTVFLCSDGGINTNQAIVSPVYTNDYSLIGFRYTQNILYAFFYDQSITIALPIDSTRKYKAFMSVLNDAAQNQIKVYVNKQNLGHDFRTCLDGSGKFNRLNQKKVGMVGREKTSGNCIESKIAIAVNCVPNYQIVNDQCEFIDFVADCYDSNIEQTVVMDLASNLIGRHSKSKFCMKENLFDCQACVEDLKVCQLDKTTSLTQLQRACVYVSGTLSDRIGKDTSGACISQINASVKVAVYCAPQYTCVQIIGGNEYCVIFEGSRFTGIYGVNPTDKPYCLQEYEPYAKLCRQGSYCRLLMLNPAFTGNVYRCIKMFVSLTDDLTLLTLPVGRRVSGETQQCILQQSPEMLTLDVTYCADGPVYCRVNQKCELISDQSFQQMMYSKNSQTSDCISMATTEDNCLKTDATRVLQQATFCLDKRKQLDPSDQKILGERVCRLNYDCCVELNSRDPRRVARANNDAGDCLFGNALNIQYCAVFSRELCLDPVTQTCVLFADYPEYVSIDLTTTLCLKIDQPGAIFCQPDLRICLLGDQCVILDQTVPSLVSRANQDQSGFCQAYNIDDSIQCAIGMTYCLDPLSFRCIQIDESASYVGQDLTKSFCLTVNQSPVFGCKDNQGKAGATFYCKLADTCQRLDETQPLLVGRDKATQMCIAANAIGYQSDYCAVGRNYCLDPETQTCVEFDYSSDERIYSKIILTTECRPIETADVEMCRVSPPYSCLLKEDPLGTQGKCYKITNTDERLIGRAKFSDVCLKANQGPASRCASGYCLNDILRCISYADSQYEFVGKDKDENCLKIGDVGAVECAFDTNQYCLFGKSLIQQSCLKLSPDYPGIQKISYQCLALEQLTVIGISLCIDGFCRERLQGETGIIDAESTTYTGEYKWRCVAMSPEKYVGVSYYGYICLYQYQKYAVRCIPGGQFCLLPTGVENGFMEQACVMVSSQNQKTFAVESETQRCLANEEKTQKGIDHCCDDCCVLDGNRCVLLDSYQPERVGRMVLTQTCAKINQPGVEACSASQVRKVCMFKSMCSLMDHQDPEKIGRGIANGECLGFLAKGTQFCVDFDDVCFISSTQGCQPLTDSTFPTTYVGSSTENGACLLASDIKNTAARCKSDFCLRNRQCMPPTNRYPRNATSTITSTIATSSGSSQNIIKYQSDEVIIPCQCRIGYFEDPIDNYCYQCYPTCRTCNGPQPYNCLTCNIKKSPFFKFNKDKCQCIQNLYIDEQYTRMCEAYVSTTSNTRSENESLAETLSIVILTFYAVNIIMGYLINVRIPINIGQDIFHLQKFAFLLLLNVRYLEQFYLITKKLWNASTFQVLLQLKLVDDSNNQAQNIFLPFRFTSQKISIQFTDNTGDMLVTLFVIILFMFIVVHYLFIKYELNRHPPTTWFEKGLKFVYKQVMVTLFAQISEIFTMLFIFAFTVSVYTLYQYPDLPQDNFNTALALMALQSIKLVFLLYLILKREDPSFDHVRFSLIKDVSPTHQYPVFFAFASYMTNNIFALLLVLCSDSLMAFSITMIIYQGFLVIYIGVMRPYVIYLKNIHAACEHIIWIIIFVILLVTEPKITKNYNFETQRLGTKDTSSSDIQSIQASLLACVIFFLIQQISSFAIQVYYLLNLKAFSAVWEAEKTSKNNFLISTSKKIDNEKIQMETHDRNINYQLSEFGSQREIQIVDFNRSLEGYALFNSLTNIQQLVTGNPNQNTDSPMRDQNSPDQIYSKNVRNDAQQLALEQQRTALLIIYEENQTLLNILKEKSAYNIAIYNDLVQFELLIDKNKHEFDDQIQSYAQVYEFMQFAKSKIIRMHFAN